MEPNDPIRRKITIVLAVTIIAAWVIAFVRDMTEDTYDIPGELTSGLVLLIGWCFVDGTVRGIKKTISDNEEKSNERHPNGV